MASNIVHVAAVRLRVKGSGELKMTLKSYDDIRSRTLAPLAMYPSTNIEPRRLTNFLEQGAKLRIEVTEIDEYFEISRVIVFAKAVYTDYPDGG